MFAFQGGCVSVECDGNIFTFYERVWMHVLFQAVWVRVSFFVVWSIACNVIAMYVEWPKLPYSAHALVGIAMVREHMPYCDFCVCRL